jgi:two-component system, OmpR family, sensor histidine kinase MprB
MSIRLRIVALLGIVVALAAVTVGLATYRTTSDRVVSELDDSLTAATRPFFEARADGPRSLPVRTPLIMYEAQILDAVGRVFATTMNPPMEPTVIAAGVANQPGLVVWETVGLGGEEFRVRTVGVNGGAIQVARPFGETARVLEGVRNQIIVIVVLTTAVASLLGWWISGRITASLRRLTATMETVSESGELGVQVPSGGGREVDLLSGAFTAMLAALSRSQQEQRRLVEDAGHELRTPLTSLRANLNLLRRHRDLPENERQEILEDLVSETEQLVALVDEIVIAATGDNTTEEPEIFALADHVAPLVDRAARRSGRIVELRSPEPSRPVVVNAQPEAVARAVSNLIDNALKFDRSEGGIEVWVDGGMLEVRDRGPGIPNGAAALVFERFYRAPEARSQDGSGLGLSIVKEVARRNGGDVHAANRAGGGAAIGFRLPEVPMPPRSYPILDGSIPDVNVASTDSLRGPTFGAASTS